MSVLERLASAQGVNNDVPNQELAKALAAEENTAAIQEIADNLRNTDKAIQRDCIKVLYEIGYINPALIADYISDFIALLTSRKNQLVWSGMIALSTIARIRAKDIFAVRERLMKTIEQGSVITVDAGIKTLSEVAAVEAAYNEILFPYLLERLQSCRPKSVAQYAESIFPAVTDANKQHYINVLQARTRILKPPQRKRVEKLLKKFQ